MVPHSIGRVMTSAWWPTTSASCTSEAHDSEGVTVASSVLVPAVGPPGMEAVAASGGGCCPLPGCCECWLFGERWRDARDSRCSAASRGSVDMSRRNEGVVAAVAHGCAWAAGLAAAQEAALEKLGRGNAASGRPDRAGKAKKGYRAKAEKLLEARIASDPSRYRERKAGAFAIKIKTGATALPLRCVAVPCRASKSVDPSSGVAKQRNARNSLSSSNVRFPPELVKHCDVMASISEEVGSSSFLARVAAACSASALSALVVTPLDVVKTRMQVATGHASGQRRQLCQSHTS